MIRDSLLLLTFFCLTLPLQASDNVEKAALDFAYKLKQFSTVGQDTSVYGFATGIELERTPEPVDEPLDATVRSFPLESVRKRAVQWRDLYFRGQDRFKVVKVKQVENLAVVLLSSRDEGSPFHGLIHPICMVKKEEVWKVAPMISNFTYAYRGIGEATEHNVNTLLKWIRFNATESYEKHVDIDRQAFQQKINVKRAEIRKTVVDSDGLVAYFMKQVNENSLEGVCAAVGYDTQNRYANGQDGELLLKSFIIGMNPDSLQRGGWRTIMSEQASVLKLKSIPKGKEAEDKVIYSFVSPFFSNICQVACFKAEFTPTDFKIKLPSELVARRLDDKFKFYSTEFERWNLDDWMQKEWDDAPRMFLKTHRAHYSDSIDAHIKTLAKAKEEQDLEKWLSCHIPVTDIEKEAAQSYLKSVCSQFKGSKQNSNRYTNVGLKHSEDGTVAVSLKLWINTSEPEASLAKFAGFQKGKKGWGVLPTTDKTAKVLIKEYGKDSKDAVMNFLNHIKGQIVNVNISNLLGDEIEQSGVIDTAKQYFGALKEANYYKASSLGAEVRKDKNDTIDKFFSNAAIFSSYDKVEIEQIKLSNFGVASVLIKGTADNKENYSIHFILKPDEGMKL